MYEHDIFWRCTPWLSFSLDTTVAAYLDSTYAEKGELSVSCESSDTGRLCRQRLGTRMTEQLPFLMDED